MRTHRIALILFEQCEILDIAGPTCVFNTAARLATARHGSTDPTYATRYYSLNGGPVLTVDGAAIDTLPLASLETDGADTLLIAGGPTGFAIKQQRLADWLRRNGDRYLRIAAVCTGTFILAQAGLLDGRRAATHWEDTELLLAEHPAAGLTPDALYVADGRYWTTAGASAGIDMALAMVEDDVGHATAFEVAQQLVVFVKRDSREPQLSTLLQSQSIKGPLDELLLWAAKHPSADLSVEKLAERANMSVRSFYRNFERQTNMPPAEWIERSRVEAAKRLLEQSEKRVEQIAGDVGFGSSDRMRRAFIRSVGASPAAYRQRHLYSQDDAPSAHAEPLSGRGRASA